jgi:hypothetical protein
MVVKHLPIEHLPIEHLPIEHPPIEERILRIYEWELVIGD